MVCRRMREVFYCELPRYILDKDYGGPGWYWYDETWSNMYGPYDSEEEAKAQLLKYAHEVLGI